MSFDEKPVTMPSDAYAPVWIARRVAAAGVAKGKLSVSRMFVLAILAGAFIALGAVFYTLVISDSALGAGPTRLIGGVAFGVGLILVLIAGGELFTGNSLMVLPWFENRLRTAALLHNWLVVYAGNLAGALIVACFVVLSGVLDTPNLSETAAKMAEAKLTLTPIEAMFRGILCNMLVCLAVWMSFAARSVGGKVSVVLLPIAGFVALGFEHSVANMYVVPVAMLDGLVAPDLVGFLRNLAVVTVGNVIGGVLIAGAYWTVFGTNRP
jgi:formate/nitrite transporter